MTANSSPFSTGRAGLDLLEEVIADAMSVDVVHLLEVVEVEHPAATVSWVSDADRSAWVVVERAVVVETGERIRLGLVLEARADVGVVDRERGGVPGRLASKLLVGERGVLPDAIDVERALHGVRAR